METKAVKGGTRIGAVGRVDCELDIALLGNEHEAFVHLAEAVPPGLDRVQGPLLRFGLVAILAARDVPAPVHGAVWRGEAGRGVSGKALTGDRNACLAKDLEGVACVL